MTNPKIIGRSFVPKLLDEYTSGYKIGSLFWSTSALVESNVGIKSSTLLYRNIWQDKAVSECNKMYPNASDTSAKMGEMVSKWLTVILFGVKSDKSYDLIKSL